MFHRSLGVDIFGKIALLVSVEHNHLDTISLLADFATIVVGDVFKVYKPALVFRCDPVLIDKNGIGIFVWDALLS